MEQYFTKLEILDDIRNTVENGFYGDISELHHETFNSGYYMVGGYQAEQALINSEYGVFRAIEKIQEYEKNNFGEINTDLSSAEKVANMLYYILGEEVLYNLEFSFYNTEVTDENKSELLEELENLIKEEEE